MSELERDRSVDNPPLEDFEPDYLVMLDEIYHSSWSAARLRGIRQLRQAVEHFWPQGHPSRLIHITGTSGKGSVSHHLEMGLGLAGSTGSWTGPHVFDYAERFRLNGQSAAHELLVEIYRDRISPYQQDLLERQRGQGLSFAQQGILLALNLFQAQEVKWGVLEVGAGGRYTPLMALEVDACVLTNVGHDHPRSLGRELWQRSLEKAGIARPGVPFFTAEKGEALPYVDRTVKAAGAPLSVVSEADLEKVRNSYPRLSGYQVHNRALALNVIRFFYPHCDDKAVLQTMSDSLPARFRKVGSDVIADLAHNPDKVAALADRLRREFPDRRFDFLVGLTRNRDPVKVFRPLFPLAGHFTVTGASYAGQKPAAVARRLAAHVPSVQVVPNERRALEAARARLPPGRILVVTGSGYTIDQALNPNPFLRHLNREYGWRGSRDREEE